MPAGSVIQGMFPHGLPRVGVAQPMQAVRAVPDWVRQRIAFGHTPAPNAPASNAAAAPVQRQVMQRMTPNGSAVAIAPPPAFGRAPGQPLPANVRQMMESAFRTSFADVRIHIDPQAPAIGALAFTTGTNIHFAPGQWNPQTPQGQRILAHELAHVVQQRSGRVRNPFGSGLAVVHDAVLEAEAERMSRGFVIQRADTAVPIEIDEPPVPVQVWEGSEDQNPNKPAFKEVKAIVASAIAGGGAATTKTLLLPMLNGILNSETVKKAMPASSDETYAIGTNGATVFLSGSGNFVKAAVKVVKEMGVLAFEDIGGRGNFSHGESHIIQSAPSVTAIAATQDCCLFCYGFLRKSGKDHQGLRAHPFPKGWIHPVLGFKLTRVSDRMFRPKGLILLITVGGDDALYRLDV